MLTPHPIPNNPLFKDLTGKVFGRYTVLSYAGKASAKSKSARLWNCRCACGNERVVHGSALVCGDSRSCGCLHYEMQSLKQRTHGMTKTREYRSWRSMIERCDNPDDHLYGGRGIKVCHRWRRSFESFYADMGRRPANTSIDRVETNGHYSCGHCDECRANGWPMNCRWATPTVQDRNSRHNTLVECDGYTKSIVEWSEVSGVNEDAISQRLIRGWAARDAIFLRPFPHGVYYSSLNRPRLPAGFRYVEKSAETGSDVNALVA